MAPKLGLPVPLALVGALVAGTVLVTLAQEPDEPARQAPASLSASEEQTYRRAIADAEAALKAVTPPDSEVLPDGMPYGWPHATAEAPDADGLTRTRWWSTSLSVREAKAFLAEAAQPGVVVQVARVGDRTVVRADSNPGSNPGS